jgi:hemoglobin
MNPAQQTTATLYDRLGRAEGIRALVDDIVVAHMENPVIRARFLPYVSQPERLSQVKAHLCAFLAAGSGGTEQYTGRSMPDTHRGMNISAAEYMAAVDDILLVLRKHSVDEQTQKDILAIAYSLKSDIMQQ